MSYNGRTDFTRELTLRRRTAGDGASLERCSGYTGSDGTLRPDNVTSKVNTGAALGSTVPEQVPIVWGDAGVSDVVCRDSAEGVHRLVSGSWGASAGTVDVLEESTPLRVGRQIIFPSGGADAKLMAFEPDSTTTKIRPLSFKGPLDYDAASKPTVTASASAAVRLFDNDDANAWDVAVDPDTSSDVAGCSVSGSGDQVVLTCASTTPANKLCFQKSLGAGLDLTAKVYLALDIYQNHATDFVIFPFSNDTMMQPSGWEITLYSDEACTAGIQTYSIPRSALSPTLSRVFIRLRASTATVRGLGIRTATYWIAPGAGVNFSLFLHSMALPDTTAWLQLADGAVVASNALLPAVKHVNAPLAALVPPAPIGSGSYSSATILQTFGNPWLTSDVNASPAASLFDWSVSFVGKNSLSASLWTWMVSNPSGSSTPIFADPWKLYTLSFTLPGTAGAKVTDEYGDYVSYVVTYQRLYDGATETYGPWEFNTYDSIATDPVTINADVYVQDPIILGVDVPAEQETANDYASSARYVMYADRRVYAGCLDWNNTTSKWARPMALEISTMDKPWAFPTTADAESPITQGVEFDEYAVSCSEIRGLLARGDDKYIFLDRAIYHLVGDNPLNGWRATRIDSVGCISGRSAADCRTAIIWHDGNHFQAYTGGAAQVISEHEIDSSLIDWTAAHGACYFNGDYVFFCKHGGLWCVMRFNLARQSWRVRYSAALEMVGICTDGNAVYGVTPAGNVIDLFGSTGADYTGSGTVREVWTRYIAIAPPDRDVDISGFVLEAVTTQAGGVGLTLTFDAMGTVTGTASCTIAVTPNKTRYIHNLNLKGNAVRAKITYTGAYPPDILSIGFLSTDEATR